MQSRQYALCSIIVYAMCISKHITETPFCDKLCHCYAQLSSENRLPVRIAIHQILVTSCVTVMHSYQAESSARPEL